MDILSSETIKTILKKHGIAPKKSLGQHFLIDRNALDKMVRAGRLSKEDAVVEIGPGLGVLTAELAKNAGRVIAVEKDDVFAKLLRETLGNLNNLEVAHEDALNWSLPLFLQSRPYKVIANLPYGITSPVIRKFLEEAERRPALLVLMVQKEVASRICAKPPKSNLLALSVQYYGTPDIVSRVDRSSFWPVPDVDSAIISIVPRAAVPGKEESAIFFRIARAGFKQPRKQLGNNLASLFDGDKQKAAQWLHSRGIDPTRRAGALSLEEWGALAKKS